MSECVRRAEHFHQKNHLDKRLQELTLADYKHTMQAYMESGMCTEVDQYDVTPFGNVRLSTANRPLVMFELLDFSEPAAAIVTGNLHFLKEVGVDTYRVDKSVPIQAVVEGNFAWRWRDYNAESDSITRYDIEITTPFMGYPLYRQI